LETAIWNLSYRAWVQYGNEALLRSAEEKQEMISLIRSAVERGITFFETAEGYGRSQTKNL